MRAGDVDGPQGQPRSAVPDADARPEPRISVCVVYGGRSSEHGVSAVSAGSVLAALDPAKYDVRTVGITRAGAWVLRADTAAQLAIVDGALPEISAGTAVHPPAAVVPPAIGPASPASAFTGVDVIFPVLHGRYGEDGTIQGLLEMAGLPYVGAGVFASAAAMDKEYTKKLLRAAGMDVGRFTVVRRGEQPDAEAMLDLGLPLFVKPARAGSSVGITKVGDLADLPQALQAAFEHDDKVLVERGVVGREIECAVLEDADGSVHASLPAEIRLVRGHDWYDFAAEYLDDASEFDLPAHLPGHVLDAVRAAAVAAFRALDGAGLARVDFFVTEDEHIIVNEVNTMPGFTPISMYPKMWAATGVPYAELLDRLIATALARGPR